MVDSSLDFYGFKNFGLSNIDSAVEQGIVSHEFVGLLHAKLINLWNGVYNVLGVNHLEQPSYIFISNDDLGRLLGRPGQMDMLYYYPYSNSIFINTQPKEFNLEKFGADIYNLLAQIVSSTLVHEETINGEEPISASIYNIPLQLRNINALRTMHEASGKAAYMKIPDDAEIRTAGDVKEKFPFEDYKMKEFIDFFIMLLLAVGGEEILGEPINRLMITTLNPKAGRVLNANLLDLDKELIFKWIPIVFNHLKYGKIFKPEFEKLYQEDKAFKGIASHFLDRGGIGKQTFDRLSSILEFVKKKKTVDFDSMSRSDKITIIATLFRAQSNIPVGGMVLDAKQRKYIKEIDSSLLAFADVSLVINSSEVLALNPINRLLEVLLYESGEMTLSFQRLVAVISVLES